MEFNIPILHVCILMQKISIDLKTSFAPLKCGFSIKGKSFVLQGLALGKTAILKRKHQLR